MKHLFFLCLVASLFGCKDSFTQVHTMPKMGVPYVHTWKHSDSAGKIVYDSTGNYKKERAKDGGRIMDQAYSLDRRDDSIYRAKYHFSDYYYMWNYTTDQSQGWGENDITLDHMPTAQEIKDYVWNTMFKGEKGRKYSALEVMGIEA